MLPRGQHPKVWPWVDLVFCSSRRHINHGIIPLMLKLSFVHILLASTWVADTADKWLFLPATSPTGRSANRRSPSCNAGPFQYGFCAEKTFGRAPTYGTAYPHLGQGGGANSTCTFYCNWWPMTVLSKQWQRWLAPAGTKPPSDVFRLVFQHRNKSTRKRDHSNFHSGYFVPIIFHDDDEFPRMFTVDLWRLTCLGLEFWLQFSGPSDTQKTCFGCFWDEFKINHINALSPVYSRLEL